MKLVSIIVIVGLNLFTSNVVFADAYCNKNFQNFLIKLKKDKQLSQEARDFNCYQYWKGIDNYKCTGEDGFCTTIDINILQNNASICDTLKAQIEMMEIDKKLPREEIVSFTFYDVEKVKKYLSPTILPCALNEECNFLLNAEAKGLNITQYNQNIDINIKYAGEDRLEIIDRFCNKENKQCEDGWITSIYEIKKGYYQPYGNGILIKKIDRIIEGSTMMFSGIYFCKFEDFNKTKLLKCYRL